MENILNHKQEIIIIGNGGHAKVVVDIIKNIDEYEIHGCTSNTNENCIPAYERNIPFLGTDEILPKLLQKGIRHFIVAIGDNQIRKNAFTKLVSMGFTPITAISRFAYIAKTTTIGAGSVIMPGVVIHPDTSIGENCIINTNVSVDHDCIIENHVHVAPGTNLAGSVQIREGAFLGIGSKVIPNSIIGEWATVGAGGTVVKNIPQKVLAVGIPAKVIKNYN